MRILFDHPFPFLLAHGGLQIQIEQTKAALEKVGVAVEHLRWWDQHQSGHIIHYFGRPSALYIKLAQEKNMKVVILELLTGLGSRSATARGTQKGIMKTAQQFVPSSFTERLSWKSFSMADACLANTDWERHLMMEMFDALPQKVHVVPNGVESVFLEEHKTTRGQWLVCSATITERKRVVELTQAAIHARTPLWVIGKAYS